MIDRITGTLLEVHAEDAIVDVHGWGLKVELSPTDVAALGPPGGQVTLLTHLLINPNDPTPRLIGFRASEGRELFRLLLGVAGLGAARALRMLGCQADAGAVAAAIARGDHQALKVKGVGPKIAKRVVSELKEKVGGLAEAAPLTPSGAFRRAATPAGARDDALAALRALEFETEEARRLLEEVEGTLPAEASADDFVRAVLLRA